MEMNGARYGAELVDAETLQMKCDTVATGVTSWLPGQRYLRLVRASETLTLQLSSNASLWTDIGECMVPTDVGAKRGVEIERVGSGAATMATLESLEICQ